MDAGLDAERPPPRGDEEGGSDTSPSEFDTLGLTGLDVLQGATEACRLGDAIG